MISRYSVKRPMTILVATILVIFLGVISFTKLSTDLLPSMDLPYVMVMTTYPGASPEKVETTVTKPLEEGLATVSGLENVTSSSSENASSIILEFSYDTNMDSALIEVSSMVDLVESTFSDDLIGAPMIMEMNPDLMPIMILGVDYEELDVKEASQDLEDNVIPELERIYGVGSVTAMGLVEEQLHITLDNDKIESINEAFIASIDSELATAYSAILEGEAQLEALETLLSEQSDAANTELTSAQKEIVSGIAQIETGVSGLENLVDELQIEKSSLNSQKSALQAIIDAGSGTTETETSLTAITVSIAVIEAQITELNSQITSLSSEKESLEQALIDTSDGKTTMNLEIISAQTQIAIQQASLETQKAEFEALKEETLASASLDELLNAETISTILVAQNFSMPAGYISDGDEEVLLKVGDDFESISEINNLVIMDSDTTGTIYLKDVATVELVDEKEDLYAKINGNDAIILSIQKQSSVSTAEVSASINEKIEELTEANPALGITSLMDQGVYIDVIIDSVIDNLLLGGIFAIFILFLFLRNVRPTIVVSVSIPISIMFAIVLMYFSGVDLNIISLAGLALGVGMLVDNSIVVIENIYRLRSQGMEAKRAAVQGAKEVAGAITASTLTTICVFMPIVFTDGLSRQLFVDMGLTIGYSLIASLLVALTVVPSLSSTLLRKELKPTGKMMNRTLEVYTNLLRKAFKKRAAILISALVLLILSSVLVAQAGIAFMPESDSTEMTGTITAPEEMSTDETREITDEITKEIAEVDGVDAVAAMEASSSYMGSSTSLYIILEEDKDRTSQEIAAEINAMTEDYEVTVEVSGSSMDMSALMGSGVVINIEGTDLDELIEISNEIKSEIADVEGLENISNGLENSTGEKRIVVDKNEAVKYQLTVAQVYQEIASLLTTETESTTVTLDSQDTSVIVINDSDDELTYDELKDYVLTVTSDSGEDTEVALSAIVDFEEEESLTTISHNNMTRTMSVTADVADGYNVGLVTNDVEEALADYEIPVGYDMSFNGENESIMETMIDLVLMILVAIVFVYLIMVAQFQSLLSPFIVMFTLPLAFTGGFIALLVTGQELSVIAMLGFVMLSGIVVNNAIVFVDYANQLRGAGMEKREALITAGSRRLRPIVMTASTTILGLSALAFAVGTGTDMIQPMAIVVIGGLFYTSILTLFVVPIMYDIFYRKDFKIISDEELDAEIDGVALISEAEKEMKEHKYHEEPVRGLDGETVQEMKDEIVQESENETVQEQGDKEDK